MFDFTVWDIARNLLLAMRWTISLSLVAFIGGGLVGAILVVLRLTGNRLVRGLVVVYVQLFQGTPLLLQLFLVYFGLAMFGLETSAMVAAALCLTLYASAYLAEIWRGGIESIDRGQWEAASSLALSFGEQMRYVIVPQAVRAGIAPTVGFMVQIIKATALTSVIGFVEMTRAGQIITNATFQPFAIYGAVALMYFALCFPLSLYSRRLEHKLRR
jgi:polar amino acid transport system permease protein